MYNRKQEKGGLCAIFSEHDNVVGVVENPYTGGFNLAYVLNGANQVVWNVSDLFIATYGNLYYGRALHFVDVRVENGILYFFINITTVQRNYPIGSVDLNRNHSSDVLV